MQQIGHRKRNKAMVITCLASVFSRSPRVLRNRQVVVIRHAIRPFLSIFVLLLAVTCVCIYSKSQLKPRVLIQFFSLAVALYALYRTTTFYGKVTFGIIPAIVAAHK